MMLLVAKGLKTLLNYNPRNIGRLIVPRSTDSVHNTPREGFLWAADNDAYNGFNEDRYFKMINKIEGIPGCLFVTCPDVVADAEATMGMYEQWHYELEDRGLPIGYVLQDGADIIPWDGIAALFIGGSTEYKLSEDAALFVKEAKERGKWVHMGRVNTWQRIEYANAIGCDSVDGTSLSMFTDTYLPQFAEFASADRQGRMW